MGKMGFPSIATQFSKPKQYTTQRHTAVKTGLPFARLLPFSTWTPELCYALPLPRAESPCSINAEWASAQGSGLPSLSELYHTPFLYPGICQPEAKHYEALPGPRG